MKIWLIYIEKKKIHKTETWFFKKINKVNKHSARLTKKKKKIQITKIRKWDITINSSEIKMIEIKNCEQSFANKS